MVTSVIIVRLQRCEYTTYCAFVERRATLFPAGALLAGSRLCYPVLS